MTNQYHETVVFILEKKTLKQIQHIRNNYFYSFILILNVQDIKNKCNPYHVLLHLIK